MRHRHFHAAIGPFLEMNAPVLGAPQKNWQCIFLTKHTAIDAEIMNTGIRVHRNRGLEGVDVAAAIFAMPFRNREIIEINFFAGDDVFFNRSSGDFYRGNPLAEIIARGLNHVGDRCVFGQTQCHGNA